MFLGDNLVEGGVKPMLEQFSESNASAVILLSQVLDPRPFAVAEFGENGEIVRLTEKPKEPKTNSVVVGVYLFSPEIHTAISRINPSWRGELEITDAIQELIDMGKVVRSCALQGWWLDTGKKDDLLEANRIVLDKYAKRSIEGEVDDSSRLVGRVEAMKGSIIENSVVRGPVSLAEECHIKNSFIGPFTSIGKGSFIEKSSIEHSVILENCHISNIERLEDSVVGKNSKLVKQDGNVRPKRFFIGDNSNLEL
jgi:glucose-1-phosphate thymidylyltransferase